WYAIAKIAGIKLCQAYRRQYGRDYISAMPCNLYGPGDYFHPERSHVIPALLQRFHEAAREGRESVTCWGSGTPRREFMHVDDVADACAFLLRHYSGESHLNIGTGTDIAIEAADVVLMSGDLAGVPKAVALSRATIRNIRQNLFWAFAYNTALIPVAAGVFYPVNGMLLSPVLAAGAMALSSVFVLANALRLRRIRLASVSAATPGRVPERMGGVARNRRALGSV
ncbi:MAG: NAD-dependent epimerase/dehydratase family protein, partial [Elioraea tepidiphila]